MIVGLPKEVRAGEKRVALTPDIVRRYTSQKLEVHVEKGAGEAASFPDSAYEAAGAVIISDPADLYSSADLILKVQPPAMHPTLNKNEALLMKEGAGYISFLFPPQNREAIEGFLQRKISSFAMELMPRITRAQAMDALSSMSTVAGYKAVLLAAELQQKFFPMLMTAAGTIPAARVFVLGAGVAGLQAIATARRLGGVVEAFDIRPAAKEQVLSLGAKFVEIDLAPEEAEGEGGYAKEVSADVHKREQEVIVAHLRKADVAISTALVPGKPAPKLISAEMVKEMPYGSVIVDLAAEAGGNCELTVPGEVVREHGVTIAGPLNLPSQMASTASLMYSKNITAFALLMVKDANLTPDMDDEIVAGTLVTHQGAVVHESASALAAVGAV